MEGEKYNPEPAGASPHPDDVAKQKRTELEAQAETLIQNPEATLREFVDATLTYARPYQKSVMENWKDWMQAKLKKRLAGSLDKEHLVALRKTADSVTKEKEQLVTAAYLYELQHRAEMQAGPGCNPKLLFRFALDFAKKRGDLLGVAMQKYINTVSLAELYKHIIEDSKRTEYEDLPLLSEVALKRLPQEAETAQKVFRDVRLDLFPPTTDKTKKRDEVVGRSFFLIMSGRYRSGVLNQILPQVKEQEPAYFNEIISKLYTKLSKDIPLEEEVFQRKLKTIYDPSERYKLEQDHEEMVHLHRALKLLPVLGQAYKELAEQKKIEKDEKDQRERAEQDHWDKERRRQEKEGLSRQCDNLLTELPQLAIDSSALDALIQKVAITEIGALGKLADLENWRVVKRNAPGWNLPVSLFELRWEVDRLEKGDFDKVKSDSLKTAWDQKKTELQTALRAAFEPKRAELYQAIDARLSFHGIPDSITEHEEYLEMLQEFLTSASDQLVSTTDKSSQQFLEDIIGIAKRKRAETRPVFDSLKQETEEGEKRAAMIAAQEEYLLDQIEKQTNYLREIYKIGTGLDLADVESSASRESGHVVGSVSMGMSVTLRQEIRLELRHELIAEDALTLEMGKDLDSIKKRMAMVNWVAPHEIAHLVDGATSATDWLLVEKESAEPMQSMIQNWKGENQKLAQEMLPMVMEETIIDAIGYRMIKAYGTANPFDETKSDRITAALRGYIAMMDVLQHILETKAQEPESKARYSAILLRTIADGEILLEDGKDNEISRQDTEDIERAIGTLKTTFSKFNEETRFVDIGQAQEIIGLCKVYFRKAEQISLTP